MPEIIAPALNIGRFRISGELIRKLKEQNNEVYTQLNNIMKDMVILRTDDYTWSDQIIYTAISPKFDYIREGEEIPEYIMLYSKTTNTFTCTKVHYK